MVVDEEHVEKQDKKEKLESSKLHGGTLNQPRYLDKNCIFICHSSVFYSPTNNGFIGLVGTPSKFLQKCFTYSDVTVKDLISPLIKEDFRVNQSVRQH